MCCNILQLKSAWLKVAAIQSSASTSSSSVPSVSLNPRLRLSLTSVDPPRSIPAPMRFLCDTSLLCASRASCSALFFGGRPRRAPDAGACDDILFACRRSRSTVMRGVTCRPWESLRYASESCASNRKMLDPLFDRVASIPLINHLPYRRDHWPVRHRDPMTAVSSDPAQCGRASRSRH
jgi:hypothetical protein